jgi:large subunit ribosomal protein L25
MRKDITVAAELRTTRGKNEARRLRAKGMAPAVIYGSGAEAVVVAVDPKQVFKILRSDSGHNTIFDLAIAGGETTPVMIVDWQLDPVKEFLLHVDLKRIDLTKRLRVSVPVHTDGEPIGVKQEGGLLTVVTRAIEIECLPDEIPGFFMIDVTGLGMGQAMRASDVPLTGYMQLVSPPESVIAHVVALRAEEVVAAEAVVEGAVAPAAEPEVVKKGKKEEEGAAPDEKGKEKGKEEKKEKGKEKGKEKEKGKKK